MEASGVGATGGVEHATKLISISTRVIVRKTFSSTRTHKLANQHSYIIDKQEFAQAHPK